MSASLRRQNSGDNTYVHWILVGWAAVLSVVGANAVLGDTSAPSKLLVDTQPSRVYIHVGKVGLGHDHAVVGLVKSGHIRLGAPREAGEIVFDMPTFAADTPEARQFFGLAGTTAASTQKEVNANMLGTSVLDVRQYPTATFQIDSALPAKESPRGARQRYRLSGAFTLHGVSRPLKIDVDVVEEREAIRMGGGFKIRQSEYGMKPFSKALGAVGVADELAIHGDLTLSKPLTASGPIGPRR